MPHSNARHFFVGFCGKIGAGKDTAARALIENKNFTKLALADGLKESAAQLFEFPVHWCYSREGKEKHLPLAEGQTVGQVLQLFGTEVGRTFNSYLWCEKLYRRAQSTKCSRVAVTDVRFLNEALFFGSKGGMIIDLLRHPTELLGTRDPNHPSEQGIHEIRNMLAGESYYYLIDNRDCSVKEMQQKVLEAVDHFASRWDATNGHTVRV